ncbi:hypothetical protein DL767_000436 [Monosporascus sp. MG133]|nr:hypothetical protein DL767_000436 [Monosporascus sp. MG133]
MPTINGLGRVVSTRDKNGFEFNIVHLSRLSTRLSQLLGSSRSFLAEAPDPSWPSENADSALQVQLGIEASFKSINAWLVNGSVDNNTTSSSQADLDPANTFDPLHHIFSASNHLVEILRHERVGVVTTSTTQNPSTTAGPCPPASKCGSDVETATSATAVAAATTRTGSRSPGDASHRSDSVVHHLVVVCVTLLLNMYVMILIALQRSADVLYSHPTRADTGHHRFTEPGNHTIDATERVHLQLVAVVQLCSYFIRRQNQTVDMLVSSSQCPELGQLKNEVEQRLTRLQESLCEIT